MALHPHTRMAQAGTHRSPNPTGEVTPPISLSTTYLRDADGNLLGPYNYTRAGNPTRALLEAELAQAEGGAEAACFSSGMAAGWALLMALQPGDHILAPSDLYHGFRSLMLQLMARWGVATTFVDMADAAAVASARTPATRLLWLETPSNPLMRITPLAERAHWARQQGITVVADNTFGTPLGQQPLALGAHVVLHSTTKYLGGHSDVLGGALVTAELSETWARVREIQTLGGAVPSPFDCWLVLRGLRSLPARWPRQCATALQVAQWLQHHPCVAAVHYPGLPSHPGHAICAAQMPSYGAMLSVEVRGTAEQARHVAGACRLLGQATSLGGTESLIEHRHSAEGPASTAPPALLRISVGLEHPQDLMDDLAQALAGVV